MRLTRRIRIQLAVFAMVALTAAGFMVFGYIKLPAMLFGVGRYTVVVELPAAGGLYASGNVTYRGTKVGRVDAVRLTDTGVQAVLSLKSGIDIPSDVEAEVHSQSAIGEQYVALLPSDPMSPPLRDGDVIPLDRSSIPPDINSLLDATSVGLEAIPRDNLKTVVDEAYTAVGGLGPELSRLVKGSTDLAVEADKNLDALTTVIDQSVPVLDSQIDTADSIRKWASNLASVTNQLQSQDAAFASILERGPAAVGDAQDLIDRLAPTLPIVLANLATVAKVAVTYQPAIEQLLVLLPQGTANMQGTVVAELDDPSPYRGPYMDFNLNGLYPPPCNTGFLPIQQQRVPSEQDAPDRPDGGIYCRIPQDAQNTVRGARNLPCLTRPGKRAPTVRMCESDEVYIPLNDGFNWKGDPNATLTGQDIPQRAPGSPATSGLSTATPPVPVAVAEYDPATGSYVGPDGKTYTQADLAGTASGGQSLEDLLLPSGAR